MTAPEFIDFSDPSLPTVADMAAYQAMQDVAWPEPEAEAAPEIVIVDFTSFVSTEEPSAEPLLGTSTETLLPADGMLLMYGDGGAGKTTLTIDAVSHLASGSSWLGIDVEREVRTLLIENEGPRGKFRQMLAEKHASWNGHTPFHPNVSVLEEPWTRFTMRDGGHQQAVAETVATQEIDLLVMGPLVTLGMVGGGTPDEISVFEGLLREFRSRIDRPLALWIVHHENKQGDVSGAWERVPDTLCHVQAVGNGHTRLVWRKARWSSESHGQSLELIWDEGRSFQVAEQPDSDPWAEMLTAFRRDDDWRTVKESAKLIQVSEHTARQVLAELVRRGEMRFEIGPSGRHGTAHCYRLKGALADLAHLSAPSSAGARGGALGLTPPPLKGRVSPAQVPSEQEEGALEGVSAPTDDDIPF